MLTADDFMPVRFRGKQGKHLVTFHAADPYQLRLTGAEQLVKIDPQTLGPAERDLFARLPTGVVFEAGPDAASLQAVLEKQKPSYAAVIGVKATVAEATLTESYSIRCTPEAARVDRLLVQFSPPRPEAIRWTLGGGDAEPLAGAPGALRAGRSA